MSKFTKSRPQSKPAKPGKSYEGFPLFDHDSGRWAKKIRGKLHYFGYWTEDPDGSAALEQFNREWPYLKEGRTPPATDAGDALTVAVLADEFLNAKRAALDTGELSERTFSDYYRTCELLVGRFGKDRRVDDLRPDDFAGLRKAMASRWGPVRLRNQITQTKMVFKYAFDQRLIDRPVHFGPSFQKPSAKALRKARNDAGPKLFETDEVRRILDAADPVMKAMVLLGLNCGFGNTDVANLPQSALDLDAGWVNFPRPKTEILRRAPLWPETVSALR